MVMTGEEVIQSICKFAEDFLSMTVFSDADSDDVRKFKDGDRPTQKKMLRMMLQILLDPVARLELKIDERELYLVQIELERALEFLEVEFMDDNQLLEWVIDEVTRDDIPGANEDFAEVSTRILLQNRDPSALNTLYERLLKFPPDSVYCPPRFDAVKREAARRLRQGQN